MAAKKKPGIDIGASAFVSDREAVLVPRGEGGEMLTLYARRVGHLELSEIIGQARAGGRSWMIPLVAASVENDDGDRFTEEEVRRLRKEIAEPLFSAVLSVNKLDKNEEDDGAGN